MDTDVCREINDYEIYPAFDEQLGGIILFSALPVIIALFIYALYSSVITIQRSDTCEALHVDIMASIGVSS